MENASKYLCAIKVIDNSLYKEGAKEPEPKYATIVVIGDRMEDMPVIRQIGDILRIQKATKKVTKDGEIKYLVDERSNWCLFTADIENVDPDTKSELIQLDDFVLEEEEKSEKDQQNNIMNVKKYYMPYRYSGKIFNFAENEEKIVNNMRSWCKEFFTSSNIIESLLSGFKSDEKEENLLCKVMKVYEHEQNLKEDENDTYGVRLKDKNHKLWKVWRK